MLRVFLGLVLVGRAANEVAALERELVPGRDVSLRQRGRDRGLSAASHTRRSCEALREHDRQVVLDELAQLVGVGEPDEHAVVRLNALDELGEADFPRVPPRLM